MVRRAVILAHDLGTVRVGPAQTCALPLINILGLPLIKRSVLTAKKAGLREFTIVIRQGDDQIIDVLSNDDRLADVRIDYIYTQDGQSVQSLLATKEKLREPFLLLSANHLYDAAILEALQEQSVPSPTAVTGIDKNITDLDVRDKFWLKIETAEDVTRAEQALYRRGGKSTDGILATFNRQVVARPLVKLLLKMPVTPNMITLTGLVLGLLSGVVFALGGYVNALLGAVLAYLSSIMDHCDGIVARLKHLESPLGTWLETACDYTSYLGIFTGMAIGLYRQTGRPLYLYTGALFIFGTVLSFIVSGYQRKKFSGDRPQDYAARWHTKVEEDIANPISWFSRRVYFLTRRSTLPYGILLFTLPDQTAFLLFFCTFGANLFWILVLYSNRLFKRPSPDPSPATKAPRHKGGM